MIIKKIRLFLQELSEIVLPYFRADKKWEAWRIFSLMMILMLGFRGLSVVNSYAMRDLMTAVADKNSLEFPQACLKVFAVFTTLAVFMVFWQYSQDLLQINWRKWLTNDILKNYFAEQNYYKIQSAHTEYTIDNPDQRISQDVNNLIRLTIDLIGLIVGELLEISAFVAILVNLDIFLAKLAIIIAIARTVITLIIGKKFSFLKFRELQLEADFRYGLVHTRDHSEAIAFYHGEQYEYNTISQRFVYIVKNFYQLIGVKRSLNLFTRTSGFFVSNLPIVFLAPRFFAGEIEFGEITQASGAFMSIYGSLSLIVDQFDRLTDYKAEVDRLGTLVEVLSKTPKLEQSESPKIKTVEQNCITLKNVTLQTPDYQRTLVTDLSVEVPPGQGLLVVGNSGIGKSSLIRVIAGLWNSGTGCIMRPKPEETLFLPQSPYMVMGDLRSQLLYPKTDKIVSDTQLQEALEKVNLADLPERFGGFNAELNWPDVLSLGEQQRLAFARLLIAQPRYAILDESTSALDVENEKRLYHLLKQKNTTFISVGHRPTLVQYHQLVLKLIGNANWQLISAQEYHPDEMDFG
jgi:putative ATP-binding cassette transporter